MTKLEENYYSTCTGQGRELSEKSLNHRSHARVCGQSAMKTGLSGPRRARQTGLAVNEGGLLSAQGPDFKRTLIGHSLFQIAAHGGDIAIPIAENGGDKLI